MAMLIGQTFNPVFKTNTEDGKEKASFRFSIATRKAFIEDKTKPNLFTKCVTYQPGLAKVLSEHFGKESDKGKAIVVYGHFDEYKWEPDYSNPDHHQYFKSEMIDAQLMAEAGVLLAQGSVTQFEIMVPISQTTRQFVVTGFEFADSQTPSSRPQQADKQARRSVVVAGRTVSEESSALTAPTLPESDTQSPL